MNDGHCALQLGTNLLQMPADLVAVSGNAAASRSMVEGREDFMTNRQAFLESCAALQLTFFVDILKPGA